MARSDQFVFTHSPELRTHPQVTRRLYASKIMAVLIGSDRVRVNMRDAEQNFMRRTIRRPSAWLDPLNDPRPPIKDDSVSRRPLNKSSHQQAIYCCIDLNQIQLSIELETQNVTCVMNEHMSNFDLQILWKMQLNWLLIYRVACAEVPVHARSWLYANINVTRKRAKVVSVQTVSTTSPSDSQYSCLYGNNGVRFVTFNARVSLLKTIANETGHACWLTAAA